MKEYDLKITIHNLYIAKLWDSSATADARATRRITGTRVASGLLSLAAFASNKKPEYRIAFSLAKRVMPTVDTMLAQAESQLSKNLRQVKEQLDETNLPELTVAPVPANAHDFFIAPGRGAPLVSTLARLFVVADGITSGLKELNNRGVITFSSYKKREQKLIAPLGRVMEEISQLITRYHRQRKLLEEQMASTPADAIAGEEDSPAQPA